MSEIENKENYKRVLLETEGKKDAKSLFDRADAFVCLHRFQDALELMDKNIDTLWEGDPVSTLEAFIVIACHLRKFDLAYSRAAYLQEKPYISQEVEEHLRESHEKIRREEINSYKEEYSDDESKIRKLLKESDDEDKILAVLNNIDEEMAKDIEDALLSFIGNEKKFDDAKTFAAMLLAINGYDKEITFSKKGQEHHFIPKENKPRINDGSFESFISKLEGEVKDTSISGTAESILYDYLLQTYPDDPFLTDDLDIIELSIVAIANSYLQANFPIDELAEKKGISSEEVISYAKKILKSTI